MALAVWPASLPKPMRDSFTVTAGEARVLSDPERGPPRSRRAWSQAASRASLTIDVDRAGLAIFETFWRETTEHGSLPFAMPDAATQEWPLLTADGAAFETEGGAQTFAAGTWLCLFGRTPPAVVMIGVRFRVTIEVFVLP